MSVGDSKGDEGENATVRHFHPRSHENKELEDEAVLLRQATIFSEGQAVVNDSPVDCQSRDRDEAKNATVWHFCARSHENKELKERAISPLF